jgi:hypothetical protein
LRKIAIGCNSACKDEIGTVPYKCRLIMPRPRTQLEALTPGQLARRWGLGVDRVRQLIQEGELPGAFRVPSAGRYGEAIRVPLATVVQARTEDSKCEFHS